jgi:hypothetical protein
MLAIIELITSINVLVSPCVSNNPGNAIKVSRPILPYHGYPAIISTFLFCFTTNCCAELMRQFSNEFRGLRFLASAKNLCFIPEGFTSVVLATTIIDSPFFICTSKKPGTYKSSKGSYPLNSSWVYLML